MSSPRLLARYRDGARDHLARADALLMRLEGAAGAHGAGARESGAELLRILHGLKAESRAMGFAEVADRAHEAEAALGAWARDPSGAVGLAEVRAALADIVSRVESRAGALRLHASGARALPAREAAPSMDLGEVELDGESIGRAKAVAAATVRVPLERLEALADISGDLFLGQARAADRQQRLDDLLALARRQQRLAQSLRRALGTGAGAGADDATAELVSMARALRHSLSEVIRTERDDIERAGRAAAEFAAHVRGLRLVPLAALLEDAPRVVSDLARSLGREARLVLSGSEPGTELERHVVAELRDPLLHLLQNAVDHGVEPPEEREAAGKPREASVVLEARVAADEAGAVLVVEVADDGRGIEALALREVAVARGLFTDEAAAALDDDQAMDLIFLPGFTSRVEPSPISGRGIGLDVVRDRVLQLGGTVRVEAAPGRGTRFILRIPGAGPPSADPPAEGGDP